MAKEERLHKFIAACGVTSRRKAEELMAQGRVLVNGERASEMGTKIHPSEDVVEVDGQAIGRSEVEKLYMILHKPRGMITSLHDPEGRPKVTDLFPQISERIYPIGRLDYLSEGLLLLTNDGELTHQLLHPSFNIEKVYEVKVFGRVAPSLLHELRKTHHFAAGPAKAQSVRVIKQLPDKTWLEFRLTEGKNREIRRLCEAVGLTVDKLKRVAIEGLSVHGLAPGKYKLVSKGRLLQMLGLERKGQKWQKVARANYRSPKKTIPERKLRQEGTRADADVYKIFRKEQYYETIQRQNQRQEQSSDVNGDASCPS